MPGTVLGTTLILIHKTLSTTQSERDDVIISTVEDEENEESTERLSSLPQVTDSVRNAEDAICSLVPYSVLFFTMPMA